MIQRVGAQQSYITSYDRTGKRPVQKDGDAPAFLLDYDENGVVYEHGASAGARQDARAGKREKSEEPRGAQALREERRAQRAAEERSAQTEDRTAKAAVLPRETDEAAREPSIALTDRLGQLFGKVREFFLGLFRSVWYGEEAQQSEMVQVPAIRPEAGDDAARESAAEDPYSDTRIRRLLADKDEEGFIEALTQGHTRVPARNTSLLTYYDRHGRLVQPSAGDSSRILRGDGGGRSTIRRPQGNYRRFV